MDLLPVGARRWPARSRGPRRSGRPPGRDVVEAVAVGVLGPDHDGVALVVEADVGAGRAASRHPTVPPADSFISYAGDAVAEQPHADVAVRVVARVGGVAVVLPRPRRRRRCGWPRSRRRPGRRWRRCWRSTQVDRPGRRGRGGTMATTASEPMRRPRRVRLLHIGLKAGLAVVDDERPERWSPRRRARSPWRPTRKSARDLRRRDRGPHVAAPVGVEAADAGWRDRWGSSWSALPLPPRGDRGADQFGADGRRRRVGVVGLEVVGPRRVHVAGEHHRVAHAAVDPALLDAGPARPGSRPRRPCWPRRTRRTAGRRTPAGR